MNVFFDEVYIKKENPEYIHMHIHIPTNEKIKEILASKNPSDEQIATEIVQLLINAVIGDIVNQVKSK